MLKTKEKKETNYLAKLIEKEKKEKEKKERPRLKARRRKAVVTLFL